MPQPNLSFCCRLISSGPANMELLFGPYICGSDGVSDHQTVSMNVVQRSTVFGPSNKQQAVFVIVLEKVPSEGS